MTCTQVLFTLFLMAPCDNGGGGDAEAIAQAVAAPARSAEDRARDEFRKPAEVLRFFGIRPGMTVLEVFAGGGWYSQILDGVVGPDGRLLAHNNAAYMQFVGAQFEARFANGGMPNTERLTAEANDLELAPASLDAALLILTWHDFLYGSEQFNWPDVDEQALVEKLCAAMKPGAVLGIVDHYANPDDNPLEAAFKLHRIDPQRIRDDLAGSCFEFKASSEVLRNPADDHTTPSISGEFQSKTDRFALKFVRG